MKTKRFYLGLIVLLTSLAHVNAEDVITMNDVTVPKGGQVTLEIGSSFETTFIGFQLDIELADGLSLDTDAEGYIMAELGSNTTDHTFTSSKTGNVYSLVCASMNNRSLPSGSVLMRVTLVADASLETGTTIPAAIKNIVFSEKQGNDQIKHVLTDANFTVTVGEPDDGRIHFDETATTLPTYEAGKKGDITMKRTIKAGNWSTIVLPFNLTRANATAIFGSDAEYAQFDGFEVDYGDDPENITPLSITINFSSYTIPARGNLAGGTPILIKTSKDISEIKLDQVILAESVSDVEKVFLVDGEYPLNGKFTGSLVKTTVPTDGLFLNSNKFYYAEEPLPISAFRGWFELDAVLEKDTDFGVKMFIDGLETKIDGLSVKDNTGTIYDLGGRKITKPQQRGIYIVNGKKILKY